MAYPQTAQVQPLGVPVGGMNTRDPLGAMDPNYAPWILNFEPGEQSLKLRNGIVTHATLPANYKVSCLMAYEDKLFAAGSKTVGGNSTKIWDVTDGAAVTEVYDYGAVLTPPNNPAAFAGYGAMINTVAGSCKRLNNATWAAFGFTDSTGAVAINPRTLTSFKGRVYMAPGVISATANNGAVNYSATVGGVTGTTTAWDVNTLFVGRFDNTGAEFLQSLGVIAPPTNKLDDQMLVVASTSGEILVYAGDNPGSVNWQQIARFKVGQLRGYVPHLEVNGDMWFYTKNGIYSLRAMFEHPSNRLDQTSPSFLVNSFISKFQQSVSALGLGFSCRMVYWPEKNCVYAFNGGRADETGSIADLSGVTFYVCNLLTNAWTLCQDSKVPIGDDCVYLNNNIYMATHNLAPSGNIYKFGTGYYDEDAAGDNFPFSYSIWSAFIPGKKDQNQIIGFEPIIKTDFTGSSVTIKAVADFGRKVSAASSQALLTAGGYQNPFYRVGVEGKFYQYRLEGSSDVASTTGLEFYNMGVAVK